MTTTNDELALRRHIIELCLRMNASGLNQGTSGNISARFGDRMLITPSGIPYEDLEPEHIASMPLAAQELEWEGPCKPSSEWHFHLSILHDKPETDGIVHTHSMFATIVSMARQRIPACHYMIAAFGGNSVECARYETFGTPELSAAIREAMVDRNACLLANHGMVATGADLDRAMWSAVELETLAKQYWHAMMAGGMVVLPDEEMDIVVERFKGYGRKGPDGTGTV